MSIFAQCQIAWAMFLEMFKETFNGRGVEFRAEKEVADVGSGSGCLVRVPFTTLTEHSARNNSEPSDAAFHGKL